MKFPFLYKFVGLLNIYFAICITDESEKVYFTNSWAVHIENGHKDVADHIAEKHGFINYGQVGTLPGYYHFVRKEKDLHLRKRREIHKTINLLSEKNIKWVEHQQVLERDKRSIVPDYIQVIRPTGYTIQDPFYSDQWYLNNVGQSTGPSGLDINVLPVWARGISGKGVVVAILDDGLDHTHPDLKRNYDERASYDFNDYDEDPKPRDSDPTNCHGTKCAGEVAAEAGNGICGVGVAFNSSIGGIRMLDGNTTDTIEGSALSFKKDYIDIYSCAWGPKDDGKRFGRPGTLASKALELGVKEGRNGLGSIFVWATGNGGLTDDDCNCDGYTTSVYTISIGAISDHGLSTYYTESCASTLAVTYSGGSHREKKENKIVTTTLNHECTDEFKGTSSAAPLAAGMIALMLEANRNLTWRDVQHMIVETSLMTSPLDEGWRRNGAGKWFNQKFGFGRMDAAGMIEKAQSWNNVADPRICWSDKSAGPWAIPSSGSILVAMNASSCADTLSEIKTVEHVQVVLSLKHRHRGHLSIELISPAGTRTQLLKTRRNDKSNKGLKDWVFMSVHFWGEDPKGVWTLAITDNSNNGRENHHEKSKFGDLEDATEALQDDIEVKDDDKDSEHEEIVEEKYKSSEEFQNSVFRNDKFKQKKKKVADNESEKSKPLKKPTRPSRKLKKVKFIEASLKHPKKISRKFSKTTAAPRKKASSAEEDEEEEEKEEERLVEELLLETKPTISPFGGIPPEYNPPQFQYNPSLYGQNTMSNIQQVPTVTFSGRNSYPHTEKTDAGEAFATIKPPATNDTAKNYNDTNSSLELHQNTSYGSEENVMLESVLKTVLTEAFSNFRAESPDYKNFEARLKGLETILLKNKTNEENDAVATNLIKAFHKGKAIDKINNVLGVLENSKNQTKLTNTSFYQNSEIVSDVLKVMKDILSTNKGDSKLNIYKTRISRLLETGSNSTRQLTEKLINDLEPSKDNKDIPSSVLSDSLNLISHIFRRKKKNKLRKHTKMEETGGLVEIPKDVSILLKGPKGKVLLPFSSIENMIDTGAKDVLPVITTKDNFANLNQSGIQALTVEHTIVSKQPIPSEALKVENNSKSLEKQDHRNESLQVIKVDKQSSNTQESNGDKRNNSDNNHITETSNERENHRYVLDKMHRSDSEERETHYLSKDDDENYENVVGKEYYQKYHPQVEDAFTHQIKESEDAGGYTIAIMKNGKKIGERRVNNEQATRYLDQHREEETDRITTHLTGNEDSRIHVKPPGSDVDVEVLIDKKLDENRPLNERPENIYEKTKNRVGFDVTKYGNEETDFEIPRLQSDINTAETSKGQMDIETTPVPTIENEKRSDRSKKFQVRVDSDLTPKSISYDLGEKKSYHKHFTHHNTNRHHSEKKKDKKNDYFDTDEEEEFSLSPIPFLQLTDPNQLPASEEHGIPSSESDNFIQSLYYPYGSEIHEIENSPQLREKASLFETQYDSINPRKKVNSVVKRSYVDDVLDQVQNLSVDKSINFKINHDTNKELLRNQRSANVKTRYQRSVEEDNLSAGISLLREKRGRIIDEMETQNEARVLKRSAIIKELHRSIYADVKRKRDISTTENYQVKRSALYKASQLESALKRRIMKMNAASPSVINIIKRVHDDISIGNSRDLRKLEKQLSKLESSKGYIKNKSNHKESAKTAVRTKVYKKPRYKEIKEDPDEYYKFGVESSGELENWTLRFYGTGP